MIDVYISGNVNRREINEKFLRLMHRCLLVHRGAEDGGYPKGKDLVAAGIQKLNDELATVDKMLKAVGVSEERARQLQQRQLFLLRELKELEPASPIKET